jgi:hypothetical protein
MSIRLDFDAEVVGIEKRSYGDDEEDDGLPAYRLKLFRARLTPKVQNDTSYQSSGEYLDLRVNLAEASAMILSVGQSIKVSVTLHPVTAE